MTLLAHRDLDTKRTHTFHEHIMETADLCEKSGLSMKLSHLCRLIALCHDLGKASGAFQLYLTDDIHKHKKGEIDHSTAGTQYIYQKISLRAGPFDKTIAQLCACTVASHHGGLINMINREGESDFINRLKKKDTASHRSEALANIDQFDKQLLTEIDSLLDKAAEEAQSIIQRIFQTFKGRSERLFALGLLQRLLLSFLIDADWQNTYEFFAGEQAQEKTLTWEECLSRLNKATVGLPNKNTAINAVRRRIAEQCQEASILDTGIYELTLPCGAGKTLSSLRFAIEHARLKNKKRIIYVVPFVTIIDQNAKEVRSIIKEDGIVFEHHSNLSEEAQSYYSDIISQNWHAQIIFTTTVQFMNALFAGGAKTTRRMQALVDSVIIFDEVQTMPVKCISMFNCALNFLSAFCNATVLLCTATQPALSGAVPHPVLLSEPASLIPDYKQYFSLLSRTMPCDKLINGGYSIEALADFILQCFNETPSVLVIVNTKKMASKLYTALSIGRRPYTLYHLSNYMCPAHRVTVIEQIKKDKSPKICISTTLIEAGVDISFGCVVRSIAGLDSIIQAAGRCNRNGEKPGEAPVYIVNPIDENVDKMRDVSIGIEKTEKLLRDIRADHLYGDNVFSQEAINEYFNAYFKDRKGEMDYPIKDEKTNNIIVTLFDLLSTNNPGITEYHQKNGREANDYILNQAYRDANSRFELIEQKMKSIIVPYDQESEKLIEALSNPYDMAAVYKALKQSQRYAVNLFGYEFDKLEQLGAITLINPELEIFVLVKAYYNEQLGVSHDGSMASLFG